jgi:hypothetical protein
MITIGDRGAIAPRVTFILSSYLNKLIIRMYSPVEHGPIIIEVDALIDRSNYRSQFNNWER